MSLERCDRPRAAAQNKSRVALRSAYKIAGKAGIRCDHPATLSTSGLGNQIVLEMRPLDCRQYSLVIVRPKPACWQILSWKTDARHASGKQMEHRSSDLCAHRSCTPLKSSSSSFCCSRSRRPRPMLSQQTAIAAPQSVALPTTLQSESVGRNSVEPECFTPR